MTVFLNAFEIASALLAGGAGVTGIFETPDELPTHILIAPSLGARVKSVLSATLLPAAIPTGCCVNFTCPVDKGAVMVGKDAGFDVSLCDREDDG